MTKIKKGELRIVVSINDLFINLIPMLTPRYKLTLTKGYDDFAEEYGMSKGLVLTYYQKLYSMLEKCLERSLNRLEKDGYIKWEKKLKVIDFNLNITTASKKLQEQITDAEKRVYETMGITHRQRVNLKINRKFKNNVCDLFEDISNYYKVYSMVLIDRDIQKVKTDIDELILKFIKTLHKGVPNKSLINDSGEKHFPYSNNYNLHNIEKLDRLLWVLPKDYKDIDFNELPEESFLKSKSFSNKTKFLFEIYRHST